MITLLFFKLNLLQDSVVEKRATSMGHGKTKKAA